MPISDLRGRHVNGTGHRIAKSLQDQLADPASWPELKKTFANVRLSRYNLASLSRIEGETGLRSHNETLTHLIENSRRENTVLPASLKLVFADDRPTALCGPSGRGKSLWLERVLPEIPGPLFLVDLADEHKGLRKL